MPDPQQPDGPQTEPLPKVPPELQPEDFYYEGPYLVFTAEFLRKRG